MEKKTLSALKKKLVSQAKGESGSTAYRPKGGDEQKFFDKHNIEVVDDANGNGDEVFKGTKVGVIDRKKERHGYTSPEDAKVNEDIDLEERELSSGEMKKREDYVKGMKKGLKDFKKRYGADAKAVMYATATKMAKEDIDYEGEDVSVDLLEFYLSLSEDNRELMVDMINDGLEEQIVEYLRQESEELNG